MKKIFTLLLALFSVTAFSQSTTVVISQVYGAGGNGGSAWNADYVELHNVSAVPQSLSGLSLQYASATNTANPWSGIVALPAVSMPAGSYFLVQMSTASTVNGVALPTPDHLASPTVSMSSLSAKVALVSGTTALVGCPTQAQVIDFIGYGLVTCAETTPTDTLNVTRAAFRNNNGCTDSDNNLADITLAAPNPRNSSTPAFSCAGGPSLSAGTLVNFGNVLVGSNSASQTLAVSGINLTGAPGTISITSSSPNFQVSSDNVNWGSSASIPYTSATLSSTTVYVRFTPQTAGAQTGTISISGGGIANPVVVSANGTGVDPSQPAITTSALSAFGSVCVGTTAGPNQFTITGSNLSAADISVAAVTGYTYSAAAAGSYTSTLTLTHAAGSYSQVIYVKLSPAAVTAYNGNIVISGGGIATPVNVAVSGTGINDKPSVSTGAATAITTSGATLGGSISSNGCSNLTAYGFEYNTTSGFANGTVAASSNLSAGSFSSNLSGLASGTTYYYKAFATNAAGTAYGTQQSFTTATPPPAGLSATSITSFGSVCVGNTEGPNMFTITGVNLSNQNISVGPLSGYAFATSAAGPFSDSLSLTQGGGSFTQNVYVNFIPTAQASYAGNIPVRGGGAPALALPVDGTGDNTPAEVLTGTSEVLSPNEAKAYGSIVTAGCSPVIEQGIELSGIYGFADGEGTKIPATQISGQQFESQLRGLVPNTTYYYKAYAKSAFSTGYGTQESFITSALSAGLSIYSIPVTRGGEMHYSFNPLSPGHYTVKIINSAGQEVFHRDLILQVTFIDDRFHLPSYIAPGVYTLQIQNLERRYRKQFMIR